MTSTCLQALRGLHLQRAVDDHEVLALDQLDAHLVGEERVLEVGAVVDAGRQHDDGRLAVEARRAPRFPASGAGCRGSPRPARTRLRANSSGNMCIIASRFSSM